MRSYIRVLVVALLGVVVLSPISATAQQINRHSNTDYALDIVDGGADFYVRTTGGIVKYNKFSGKGIVWSNLGGKFDNETWAMAVDGLDRFWVGGSDGLIRFDGQVREKHQIILPDNSSPQNISSMVGDGAGGLWVASSRYSSVIAISHFDGTNWRHFDKAAGLPDGWFSDLLVVSPTEIWFTGRDQRSGKYNHTVVGHIKGSTIDIFGSEHGLPTAEGQAIARDSSGRIWVGSAYNSSHSLTVLENGTWKTVKSPDVRVSSVYSIEVTKTGDVWLAGYEGAARLINGTWTNFKSKEIAGNYLRAVTIAGTGDVWISSDSGIARIREGNTQHFVPPQISGQYATKAIRDSRGEIILATSAGVDRLTAEGWIRYDVPNEPRPNLINVAPDEQGNMWAVTNPYEEARGISRWDGTTWKNFSLPEIGVSNDTIFDLTRASDGTMWFAGKGFVSHFDGVTWMSYSVNDSLREFREYQHVAADSQGNIWVFSRSLVPYDKIGELTVANNYSQLHKFDGVAWTTHTEESAAIPMTIGDLEVDRQGNVWYFTDIRADNRRAFFKFDGITATRYQIPDASGEIRPANVPLDLAIDKEDNLWFACPLGSDGSVLFDGQLSKWDRTTWTHYTIKNGFPSIDDYTRAHAVDVDRNGDIWIGTGNYGVVRFDGTWKHFPNDAGLINPSINAIAANRDGSIWTASYGLGMFRGLSEIRGATSSVDVASAQAAALSVYPNPFVHETTISFTPQTSGMFSLTIQDVLGRTVQMQSQAGVAHTPLEYQISSDGLAKGIYHAVLTCGDKQVAIERVVVE